MDIAVIAMLLVVGIFYFLTFLCCGRLIWLAVLLCKTSDSNMSSHPIEESNSNFVQSIPKDNISNPKHLWKKYNSSDLMRPGVKGQGRNSEEITERETPHIIIHSPIQTSYECESVV